MRIVLTVMQQIKLEDIILSKKSRTVSEMTDAQILIRVLEKFRLPEDERMLFVKEVGFNQLIDMKAATASSNQVNQLELEEAEAKKVLERLVEWKNEFGATVQDLLSWYQDLYDQLNAPQNKSAKQGV